MRSCMCGRSTTWRRSARATWKSARSARACPATRTTTAFPIRCSRPAVARAMRSVRAEASASAGNASSPSHASSPHDCPTNQTCTQDGRCVPKPSGSCTTNAECGDLICTGGQCVACTAGGNQCGAGQTCAPTGHCVTASGGTGGAGAGGAGDGGVALDPGEAVKGGACACSVPGRRGSGPLALGLALLLPLGWTARRSRRRRSP